MRGYTDMRIIISFYAFLLALLVIPASYGSVLMDSDIPGSYYPREMISKGEYRCRIRHGVFTTFDQDKPIIEQSPFDPSTAQLEVIYEIARLPKEHQSITDPNYSKDRKVKSIYMQGRAGFSISHYWTDRGETESAGRMALLFNEDGLTLGHGGYGNKSGIFLTLTRVYKEDWQGFAVVPIMDSLLTTFLSSKRKIIVGE